MSPSDWIELAKIVPGVLWFLLAAGIIAMLWPTIKRDLIPNLSGLKLGVVELTFARAQLDQAALHAGRKAGVEVSLNDRSQVLRRAAAAARVLAGMRVLWVDDNPSNNLNEVHLLNSLGVYVDQVTSTGEALSSLAREKYDAVVSDIARGSDADAGIRMVADMWNSRHTTRARGHLYRWTVFYIGSLDLSKGVPPYAFGITNRPDHLLHFIIDIAERERL